MRTKLHVRWGWPGGRLFRDRREIADEAIGSLDIECCDDMMESNVMISR